MADSGLQLGEQGDMRRLQLSVHNIIDAIQ